MIDDARAYTELMAIVRERLPALHDQIADEVARGKELRGTDIERTEREGRDRILGDGNLGRIGEADVSVFPYSDEERLDLLVDALTTSAQTAQRSLEALGALMTELSIPSRRVNFRRPESDETAVLEVPLAPADPGHGEDLAAQFEVIRRSLRKDRNDREH
ncbi:hypothetical protein [Humibacillus xanthopallidus]|uniref:hypothetical protein n=1 Tax=Humibacillus xanthopallidus TaxID=412689 RepID=UPI001151A1C5|nr:hypothetical protein [Humibacillus xanthopallidus]